MVHLTNFESDYVKLVKNIRNTGERRPSRAGFTQGLFAQTLQFNGLQYGEFPILEGRKIYYRGVLGELAAMLRGPKHVDDFTRFGCNYWHPWADSDGSLRLDYGNTWRNFNGYDQLQAVASSLLTDPYGRRHIIVGYRPDTVNTLSLPSCHILYQWYVTTKGLLHMHWYQRSTDVMIGLPSDVILAATWNLLMAKATGLKAGSLYFSWGDTHIYETHNEAVETYLTQVAKWRSYDMAVPRYNVLDNDKFNLFDFHPDSLEVTDYNPAEAISFPISV